MPHVSQTLPQDRVQSWRAGVGTPLGSERGGWLLPASPGVLSSGLQALT